MHVDLTQMLKLSLQMLINEKKLGPTTLINSYLRSAIVHLNTTSPFQIHTMKNSAQKEEKNLIRF